MSDESVNEVVITLDTDATLAQRLALAERKLVLYTATEDADSKAQWLEYYTSLKALSDSSTVMDIKIPDTE